MINYRILEDVYATLGLRQGLPQHCCRETTYTHVRYGYDPSVIVGMEILLKMLTHGSIVERPGAITCTGSGKKPFHGDSTGIPRGFYGNSYRQIP
jgi:hypothetical protein